MLNTINPQEVIDLTGSLVKINSVWDPAAGTSEKEAAEFVARWAGDQGFGVEVDEAAPGRPNVVVTHTAGPGPRTLMFEGHTDVVTPGDAAQWRFDPFGAQIVDRRMYGRGANDTKGNLAAMLVAMAALKRSGAGLSGTVVGGVLCDEEDQMIGVQDFIRRGRADRVTAAVICEPQDGMICTSQKGALRARFDIAGKMSHGAMPLAGLNTAPAVAEVIRKLHALESEAVRSLGRDPHLGWPSFTPTVVQAPAGGAAQLNVMPGEARVLVDIRTIPAQSHAGIVAALKRLAAEVQADARAHYGSYDRLLGLDRPRDIAVGLDILTDRPCTRTAPRDPVVLAAEWATRSVTGREPVYGGVPGATDGTFLWALKQIPIVTMGAGDREVPHQKDEWVDLDQLVETAKIYALIALHYLGAGPNA
ncbi:MAG: M20/M25/M40 family metallo-hydrolase [Desulfobacterales bacterium]|nr:M20/M25/M40 family metallo-hydrolase [Desulfobacterales bacterium]